MLTPLQKNKLTHYFNILDFDKSGTLEKADFTSIGENLCVLWGFFEGSSSYDQTIAKCEQTWKDFRAFSGLPDEGSATLEEWLKFADERIVNGTIEQYEYHIRRLTKEIINYFDENGDGQLSLNEYVDLFMAYRIEIRYSAKAFTKLDRNHNDYISQEELLVAVDQFFRSNDDNAPGNWLFGFWEGK